MLRTQKRKHVKPSLRRHMPPERTIPALKVLRAHRKFGEGTLEQDQIDKIPGIRSIALKEDNAFELFNTSTKGA